MAKRKWTKQERAAQSLKIRAALAAKAANKTSFVVADPVGTPKSSRQLRDAVEVLYENNIITAPTAVDLLLSITGRA